MDIQLKRGYVEMCALAAMLNGETYGYKLIKDLSPVIEISESTLYPVLKRLENSGCLTVRRQEHNGRLRKYYLATETGKQRIKDFLNDFKEIETTVNFIKEAYGE